MENNIICNSCGQNNNFLSFYPKKSIVKCPDCNLVFAVLKKDLNVTKIYESDYFNGSEYQNYLSDKVTIQNNFKARIKDLKKLNPKGKLLEIGCAYGLFLELANKHWDVVGVDITVDGIENVKKMKLDGRLGNFLEIDFKKEKFDLICMWDTIEHLSNPHQFLKKAESLLSPGGHIIITTGDIDSVVSKVRKDKWRLVHPPSHIYYFSPKTLDHAFKGLGMKPVKTTYVGYSRYYKSMLHNILKSDSNFLYKLLTLNGKVNFPVYLNLRDIMMYVAKKE